jgi:hypothetical protein
LEDNARRERGQGGGRFSGVCPGFARVVSTGTASYDLGATRFAAGKAPDQVYTG